MRVGIVVLILLVALLLAITGASLYRFAMLRRGGTSALLRVLPADGGEGWRHGLIRYGDESLVFFKLTSLRIGPDSRISRAVEVGDRRGPRGDEYDIMTDAIVVAHLVDGSRGYEVALDRGSLAALQSWVEARPTVRR
jgi:hypothetical protein